MELTKSAKKNVLFSMSSNYSTLYKRSTIVLSLYIFLFCIPFLSQAQEEEDEYVPMRVVHCTAVDQKTNIINVHVNDSDEKWVGTDNGVYQVHSADNGSRMPIPKKGWAPLLVNSGNDPMTVDSFGIMDTAMVEGKIHIREDNQITAAYHDPGDGSLWVGTSADGLYRFGSGRRPPLIEHFHSGNSKLRDNYINCIFIDQYDLFYSCFS